VSFALAGQHCCDWVEMAYQWDSSTRSIKAEEQKKYCNPSFDERWQAQLSLHKHPPLWLLLT
jgi:hypothetical protein